MTYRMLLSIFLVIISIFTWWLSGYNFDERNIMVAYMFIVNIAIIGFLISVPINTLDNKIFKTK